MPISGGPHLNAPVAVSGTGPEGAVQVFADVANPVNVVGNLTVVPGTGTQFISGTVHVDNSVLGVTSSQGSPVWVTGSTGGSPNVNITASVGLTASISNFPATQTVTGTVHVDNIPATQTVTGTVHVDNPVSSVSVSNFPAVETVTASAANPVGVTGSVFVINQVGAGAVTTVTSSQANPVWITSSGGGSSVTVTNFPATQTVTGTVHIDNSLVTITGSATVAVSNLPATQTVTGTVHVDNPVTTVTVTGVFPAVGVTGVVGVSNFPATQVISSTLPFYVSSSQASPVWVTGAEPLLGTGDARVQITNAAKTLTVGIDGTTMRVALYDQGSQTPISSAAGDPGGGERGLIVRNIPSGIQRVTSTLASPVWVSATGSFPAAGVDGTGGLHIVRTDNSGFLAARLIDGAGNFISLVSGAVLVQGLTGGTPVAVTNSGGSYVSVQGVTGSQGLLNGTNPVAIGGSNGGAVNFLAAKGPSVPASVNDVSLVVAISPNSPATVYGSASAGSPAVGNPVLVAGTSSDGNVRIFRMAADGTAFVRGDRANNNGIIGSSNVGVMPAVANIAVPGWTENNMVVLSTDLSGVLRTGLFSGSNQITTHVTGAVVALDTHVHPASTVDAGNTSVATLGSNAAFTGTGVMLIPHYSSVKVYVSSSAASAASGVQLQFSPDNSVWEEASTYTYTPGSSPNKAQIFEAGARGNWFRVVYANGAAAQTSFLLQTTLVQGNSQPDLIDIATPLNDNAHSWITKGLIAGRSTAGPNAGIIDVKVSPAGALATDASNSTNVAVTSSAANPVWITSSGGGSAVSITNVPLPVTSTQASPVWVTMSGGGSSVSTVEGSVVTASIRGVMVEGNDTDAEPVSSTGALAVESYGMVFNGTTWDRMRGSAAAGVTVSQSNVPFGTYFVAGSSTVADGFTNPANAIVAQVHLMGWNGATWDRIKSEPTNVDADGPDTGGVLAVENYNMVFNGTNWDRMRGSVASGSFVTVTGTVTVSQSNTPAGTQVVSATLPFYVTSSLASPVMVSGNFGITGPVSVTASTANPVGVRPAQGATSTVTNVDVTGSSVQLLAANAARLGATIMNTGGVAASGILYVKFGTAATVLTSHTVRIAVNGYYEVPFGYTGIIHGICSGSQTTRAMMTEITP